MIGALLFVVAAIATAPAPSPPVIHESFTPLRCNPNNTLGMEGCAEHQVLKTDAQINAEVKVVFKLLRSNQARVHFVAAERAWLSYRTATCNSRSDLFEGGSQAVVIYAQCEVTLNKVHLADLKQFADSLRPS